MFNDWWKRSLRHPWDDGYAKVWWARALVVGSVLLAYEIVHFAAGVLFG